MRDHQAGPPGMGTFYGCLAVLVPAVIALGLALVVFAWNVNGAG